MSALPLLAMRILGQPQMVLPSKAAVILSVLEGRIGLDASNLSALAGAMPAISRPMIGTKSNPDFTVIGGVAVIQVLGTLVARGDIITASSGVLSYERIKRQIMAAIHDDAISAILLDIDSPGGEALGAFELADYVRSAATKKPIVSSVAGLCCSAAFAIAASTTKIVATKSSLIGSVGVVAIHLDKSRKLDAEGITPTMIFAGDRKVDGNAFEKLSDEARDALQADVDQIMDMFIDTVAAGRPKLSRQAIRAQQAAVYMGSDAVAAGLVDEVGIFDDVVRELAKLHSVATEKGPRLPMFAVSQADVDRSRTEGARAGAAATMARVKA
jgi:capsid assembly protease